MNLPKTTQFMLIKRVERLRGTTGVLSSLSGARRECETIRPRVDGHCEKPVSAGIEAI